MVVKAGRDAAQIVVGDDGGVCRRRHERLHRLCDRRNIAGRNDVVSRDTILHTLEWRPAADAADAGVRGRIVDDRRIDIARSGWIACDNERAPCSYIAIQLGKVAGPHQGRGNGVKLVTGASAVMELIVGDEEEQLVAGMRDLAPKGSAELILVLDWLGSRNSRPEGVLRGSGLCGEGPRIEDRVAYKVRDLPMILEAARLHGEVHGTCARILRRRRAGDHLKLIDGVKTDSL